MVYQKFIVSLFHSNGKFCACFLTVSMVYYEKTSNIGSFLIMIFSMMDTYVFSQKETNAENRSPT